MISIWHDPDCDQIWITDEGRSFAGRSLVAGTTNGNITIALKAAEAGDYVVNTAWTNIAGQAGQGFADQATALAYLQGEFAKGRPSRATIAPYPLSGAASFAISHGLPYAPATTILDPDGAEVDTDVAHAPGLTTLTFAQPFTGTLYLG